MNEILIPILSSSLRVNLLPQNIQLQTKGRSPLCQRRVRNGADRVAFPPPKVGVTRTLPYPFWPRSRDSSVGEVETFICILGEEDVVYDVYVAAAAIDIRPTTKGTVGSGNATSELSWAIPPPPYRTFAIRSVSHPAVETRH
ncbi:unnamed protein product [Boreogadus saida]